jgi:uncharacterized membrane protein YjjP (DUF1212 family)
MHYTVSFVFILYAISATVDAALGITTLDLNKSLAFRIAAVAMVLSIYINYVDKKQSIKTISPFAASLILSAVAMALGNLNIITIINIGVKIAATILTIKPSIMEVEIVTKNEEKL